MSIVLDFVAFDGKDKFKPKKVPSFKLTRGQKRILKLMVNGWGVFQSLFKDAPCQAWAEKNQGRPVPDIKKLSAPEIKKLIDGGFISKRGENNFATQFSLTRRGQRMLKS